MTDIVERLRAENAQFREQVAALLEGSQVDEAEIERLRSALQSIAKNTCCDRCQEAALVARRALEPKP